MPGLESTKEQFSTYEPFFLRRGVATLSVEGPGQGEGGFTVPFRDATYAVAMAAVADAIDDREHGVDGVDPQRVVVVGTSFGGYLALRHAAAFRRGLLRGVVDIAGPYDLRAFDELQPVTRDGFRDVRRRGDRGRRPATCCTTSRSTGVLDGLAAPVLVVHGEQDRSSPCRHAHRIVAALGDRATRTAGARPATTRATTWPPSVRPAVADWTSDRLGELEVQQ